MSKHSPGPWLAYNAQGGRIFKHWRIRGNCVRNDPPFAIIDSNGKLLPEYEVANARLMAASPELLKALEEIAAYPLNVDGYASLEAVRMRFVAMQVIARAAIDKAKGGDM